MSRPESDEAGRRDAARSIDWFTRPAQIRTQAADGSDRWFADGTLNACYNALDRHVIRGRGDDLALVHHRDATDRRRRFSYADLLERVAQLAGGLWQLGVRTGDRVMIMLPPVPELVVAMLACARVGLVHAVVTTDHAPDELSRLIETIEPRMIITASCTVSGGDEVTPLIPLLDEALAGRAESVGCLILQRPELTAELRADRDVDFGLIMRPGAFEPAVAVDVAALDPLALLTFEGPDGVEPVETAGQLVAASRWAHESGFGPGDVVIAAGASEDAEFQVAGVYAPLLVGAATVLYEGPPLADHPEILERLIEEHGARATVWRI